MKDRKEEPVEQELGDNSALAFRKAGSITIYVDNFDYLIGKLFTHTELLGLPERQLSAFKSTTREMFWDWYNAYMINEHGFADPSRQHRIEAGIEKQ